jgi:hypothetical protein
VAGGPRSTRAAAGWALQGLAGVVVYGTLAGLALGGGITLRAVLDARAAPAPPSRVQQAATPTTLLPLPAPASTTTTILFELRQAAGVAAAVPSPTPSPAPAPAAPAAATLPAPPIAPDRWAIWLALADCESGLWGAFQVPIPGSARWDIVDEIHQGGLQIRAGQWDQHRPPGYPDDAHVATPAQQVAVAEIILAGQGWRAWPTCGPRVGLQRLTGEEIVEPD